MDIRYESEELDKETLAYLQEVRDREGRGSPGVYLDSSQAKLRGANMLWWAMVGGPVILLLTLLMTWGSLRNPTKVALLMTAGFFLGGWMILAWLRCLIARQREDYLGHFKFIDPMYVWYASGRGVWVTPIGMLLRADVHHEHTGEGNYKNSTVTIHLADGRTDVVVTDVRRADFLEAYLNRVAEERSGSPAERGYRALGRGDDRDDYDDDRGGQRVEGIPEPHKARSSLWWLRYLVLIGSVVPLFFVCKSMAAYSRDGAMYRAFKDQKQAHARAYLLDPGNTRHRAEMLARLGRFHEDAATRLDSANVPNADVKAGLKGIILGLKDDPAPVVTVRFFSTAKGEADPGSHLSVAVRETMNREMIKAIDDRLGKAISSEDLLDFAETTEAPATIDVDTVLTLPAADVPGVRQARIDWTVTFQANPGAEKKVAKLSAEAPAGADQGAVVRELYKQFANKLLPE